MHLPLNHSTICLPLALPLALFLLLLIHNIPFLRLCLFLSFTFISRLIAHFCSSKSSFFSSLFLLLFTFSRFFPFLRLLSLILFTISSSFLFFFLSPSHSSSPSFLYSNILLLSSAPTIDQEPPWRTSYS